MFSGQKAVKFEANIPYEALILLCLKTHPKQNTASVGEKYW